MEQKKTVDFWFLRFLVTLTLLEACHQKAANPAVEVVLPLVSLSLPSGRSADTTRAMAETQKEPKLRSGEASGLSPYQVDPKVDLIGTSERTLRQRRVQRIVLDPGHGGRDAGAVGHRGLREKDVALDVARRAATILAQELGVATLLTRSEDIFLSLEDRAARANGFGADLFLSLHCNASEVSSARGVQTFVLDTNSDAAASRLAARENAALPGVSRQVAHIVADFKRSDLGLQSTHFAHLLQRATLASLADPFLEILDQRIKRAGFFVLARAHMPGVVFEMSFLSNVAEEKRLAHDIYRRRFADAIVNAVRAYQEGSNSRIMAEENLDGRQTVSNMPRP